MAQSSKSCVRRLYWRPGRNRFLKKKFGLVILLLVEMFPGIVNNVQAVIKHFP